MSVSPALAQGPAVWHGPEIDQNPTWCYQLTDRDIDELANAVRAVASQELPSITRESFPLPDLAAKLARCVDDLVHGPGFVLIRGVPVDDFDSPTLERLFYGLGQHIGIPIPQNDAGQLLVPIRDEGLDFSNPVVRGYQTSAPLNYHSDSTDVVGLLCIRPAKSGGISTVVSAGAVFNEAVRRRPDLVELLMQPWWWDRRKADLDRSFFECRIFAFDNGNLTSYYGRSHLESASRAAHVPPLDKRQRAALDLVDSITNDPAFVLNMRFRPGDIQFLNNYKVWHSRTAFEDHPEPERRRELLRLWLTLRVELNLPADFAAGGITNRAVAFET